MSNRWQNLIDSPTVGGFFAAYRALKTHGEPHEWAEWGEFLLDDAWMLQVRNMCDYHSHRAQWINFLRDYTAHVGRRGEHQGTHYSIHSLYSHLLQHAAKYSAQHFTDFVNDSLPHCWDVTPAARCVVREQIALYGEDALDLSMVVFDHVSADDLLSFFCDHYSPHRLMFDRWAVEGFAQRLEFSPQVCERLAQCAMFQESAELRRMWEQQTARHQREQLSAAVAGSERMSVKKL